MERFNVFSYIGPAALVLAVLISAHLFPGYSHPAGYISELGAAGSPTARIMNLGGNMVFGVSILLFSLSSLRTFPGINHVRVARFFLFISGLFIIVLGVYTCDEGCAMTDMSLDARIHNLAALIAFSSAAFCQLIMGAAATSREPRDIYFHYSLTIGFISVVVYIIIILAGAESPYRGLFQKLFVLNYCLWLVLSGRYGGRRSRRIFATPEKDPPRDGVSPGLTSEAVS